MGDAHHVQQHQLRSTCAADSANACGTVASHHCVLWCAPCAQPQQHTEQKQQQQMSAIAQLVQAAPLCTSRHQWQPQLHQQWRLLCRPGPCGRRSSSTCAALAQLASGLLPSRWVRLSTTSYARVAAGCTAGRVMRPLQLSRAQKTKGLAQPGDTMFKLTVRRAWRTSI